MPAIAEKSWSSAELSSLWDAALTALRRDNNDYIASQLAQLEPVSFTGTALVLGVPDQFMRDWVDDHYRQLLEATISKVSKVECQVTCEIVERAAPPPRFPDGPPVTQVRQPARLNEKFTFETYVVADSNQLPAAAALAVAENPGKAYNPLFIYGSSGLGKTHLLHAIGNRVLSRNPSARVVYLSTEEFTNQFIESLRDHRMTEFRRRFREECDVLLIDDIQFLGKKQETQNEFFYTFNALHQVSKAIVISSDTVPSEIPSLEDRLRSRFTMGLITDVQEPNFEMRVAILKKKAASDRVDLPDNVAHFIARHVQRNVRELEGALIKLAAVQSLTRQPLTEEFAAQVLRDVLPAAREIDIETIQKEVARYFKVTIDDLKSERRVAKLVHARHIAMYLCRTLTGGTQEAIGEKFRKDHSTLISAMRKIERLKDSDEVVKRELSDITARLQGGAAARPS